MAIKTASNRRAEAASAVSSQSVVINTGTGLSTYSQTAGAVPVGGNGPTITSVAITDNNYNVWDDTAVNNLGNSFIKITGTNFQSTANVWVGGVMIPYANVTYVSSTELHVALSPNALGATTLSVFNSNSAGAIYASVLNFSIFPTWTTAATLANVVTAQSFGVNLSATSDSTITYANTTALPPGTTLASNGYFSGTVTTGSITTYTFTVDAKDAENQDALRTFSLTVTVVPQPGLYAWGQNNNGQLGQNDSGINRSSPVQVGALTNWSQISTGGQATVAIKTDGTLWLWGYNNYGQLAQNDTVSRSSPVQVGAATNWSLVSMGQYSTAAIKNNGTLWAWGLNVIGQLGTNDRVYKSSPVQVGVGNQWSLVSTGGGNFTAAIKTNGTLWTWGNNANGTLGTNDRVSKSSPVQVGSLTTWSRISVGQYDTAAIKTDGTLWTWGVNAYGQLGTGDTVNRSSPVQVGAATTWSLVSMGQYNTAAIKTDGTLWLWGFNGYGGLGTGNTVYKSSPTQVGALTNWSQVSMGQYNTAAIKTDGTLWMWGKNDNGQLGTGDAVNKSSPVQVGAATTWSKVSMGGYGSATVAILN